MKKHLLFFFLTMGFCSFLFSQEPAIPASDSKLYEELKLQGKIPSDAKVLNFGTISSPADLGELMDRIPNTGKRATRSMGCGSYIPVDSTFLPAMAPNDDGSSSIINFTWPFCFYGTNYTSCYINNNGNISFGASYGTFTATGFPSPTYVMVAPFWGDVDTRPAGGGSVWYLLTASYLIVNWESVGYYSMETDKLNTFQLIITDGVDPILPGGNNIAFNYGDMEWTTGAASGGIGGFGGTPATVGLNKGDGINYIQLGRFDQPGAAYDGGYGASDGVSWLDNQSFYFNACSSTNIAPIASGINNCDTIRVCGTGDTLILNSLFLSPEIGQTTTITINTGGMADATILSNVPGNSASALVQIIAGPANAGNNPITFTATDDGSPAATTIVTVNVFVDTVGLSGFNPVISGLTEFCEGATSTLTVSPGTYDTYLWNTGSITNTATVDSSGLYFVTSTLLGCSKTSQVYVTVNPLPTPLIIGAANICAGATSVLTVDSLLYASYNWSTSSTNDSVTVPVGTYTVMVTDTNGCSATSPSFTVFSSPLPAISGPTAVCNGELAPLTTTTPYLSYSWSPGGSTNDTINAGAGSYTVTVLDTAGCLITSPPYVVSVFNYVLNVTGVVPYCSGNFITITAAGSPPAGASYVWSTGSTMPSINVAAGGTYSVTLNYPNGCTTDTTFAVPNPNPLPTPLITGSTLTCNTTNTTIAVDSASLYTSFLWSNSSTGSSISILNGTFTVTVTDVNGCSAVSPPFTVTNFNPLVSINSADFCPGDSTLLNAVSSIPAGANYLWSNAVTSQSQYTSAGGTFYVIVSYANGCSVSDTVNVTVYADPAAGYTSDPPGVSPPGTVVSFTDVSIISSGFIVNWDWDFGDSLGSTSNLQNPTYVYAADGVYIVTLAVQSDNGCWDTVRIEYVVASDIEVPNVFTPNNDGNNDVLAFNNLKYFPGTALTVFNRWGNKVYTNPDYHNDWNGSGCSDGVYYFILEGPELKETKYGFVQMIR